MPHPLLGDDDVKNLASTLDREVERVRRKHNTRILVQLVEAIQEAKLRAQASGQPIVVIGGLNKYGVAVEGSLLHTNLAKDGAQVIARVEPGS